MKTAKSTKKKRQCPNCGWRVFDVSGQLEGQIEIEIELKCPHCHKVVTVPVAETELSHAS